MAKAEDITGKRFGRLTVLGRVPNTYGKNGKATVYWFCKCDCGKEFSVYGSDLRSGKTKSCGCQRISNNKSRATIHYEENKKLYYVYHSMKDRCNKPQNKSYRFYGGRGITVCDEWNEKYGFTAFMKWAYNNGYKEGLELDRIDNNGNYEPSNCRWVTHREQAHNTRQNVYAEYNGEKRILSDWAREFGINIRTFCYHYNQGKTIGEIVFFYEQKGAKNEATSNKTCKMA